jgi:hypothetical protein
VDYSLKTRSSQTRSSAGVLARCYRRGNGLVAVDGADQPREAFFRNARIQVVEDLALDRRGAALDENIGDRFAELRPVGDFGEKLGVEATGVGDGDQVLVGQCHGLLEDRPAHGQVAVASKRAKNLDRARLQHRQAFARLGEERAVGAFDQAAYHLIE